MVFGDRFLASVNLTPFRPWGTNAFFRHSTLFHNIAPTAPAGGPLGFRTLAFTPPRFRLKSAIRSIEYFTFPKWAWGLLPPFQVRMNGLQGVRLRACSGAARSGYPSRGLSSDILQWTHLNPEDLVEAGRTLSR